LPDDAGHLVAIKLHYGIFNVNFYCHKASLRCPV